jgi:hypothetical protein
VKKGRSEAVEGGYRKGKRELIKYHCQRCGQKLGVPDEYAGRRVRCTKCNEPSVAPAESEREDPVVFSEVAETDDAGEFRLMLEEPIPRIRSAVDIRRRAARNDRKDVAGESSYEESLTAKRLCGAVACAVVLTILAVGLWVGVFWFVPIDLLMVLECLVPLAAAAGLGATVQRSGVLIGAIAVVIGLGGVVAGKYMLAKWVYRPWILHDLSLSSADEFMGYVSLAHVNDSDAVVRMGAAVKLGYTEAIDPNVADEIAMMYAWHIRYERPIEEYGRQFGEDLQKVEAEAAQWSENERTKFMRNNWYRTYRESLLRFLESDRGQRWLMRDAWASSISWFDSALLPFTLFVAYRLSREQGLTFD